MQPRQRLHLHPVLRLCSETQRHSDLLAEHPTRSAVGALLSTYCGPDAHLSLPRSSLSLPQSQMVGEADPSQREVRSEAVSEAAPAALVAD